MYSELRLISDFLLAPSSYIENFPGYSSRRSILLKPKPPGSQHPSKARSLVFSLCFSSKCLSASLPKRYESQMVSKRTQMLSFFKSLWMQSCHMLEAGNIAQFENVPAMQKTRNHPPPPPLHPHCTRHRVST